MFDVLLWKEQSDTCDTKKKISGVTIILKEILNFDGNNIKMVSALLFLSWFLIIPQSLDFQLHSVPCLWWIPNVSPSISRVMHFAYHHCICDQDPNSIAAHAF